MLLSPVAWLVEATGVRSFPGAALGIFRVVAACHHVAAGIAVWLCIVTLYGRVVGTTSRKDYVASVCSPTARW